MGESTKTKFYKITNRTEQHHGMKYQDGLNVDVLPFNPRGSCSAGGIYFTTLKHILHFQNFGCWVREVELPENELVWEEKGPYFVVKYKAHSVILKPRRPLNPETIMDLIIEGADFKSDWTYDNFLLKLAVCKKHIKQFMQKTSDKDLLCHLLAYAAFHSKPDVTLQSIMRKMAFSKKADLKRVLYVLDELPRSSENKACEIAVARLRHLAKPFREPSIWTKLFAWCSTNILGKPNKKKGKGKKGKSKRGAK